MRRGSEPLINYAGAMNSHAPRRKNVIAVLIATTAALFARAWLQITLVDAGYENSHAADLAYLVVPPILFLLLVPALLQDRKFLQQKFDMSRLTIAEIASAIGIGFALRLAWWAQLVAGISFGIYRNQGPNVAKVPEFLFDCPAPGVLTLGFLVMVILVPLIEEVTHRGYIQSALYRQPAVIAILVSAALFTLFHPPSNWMFVFSAGVVFGIQFLRSRSLWPSLLTHATVNGLIQIDWRCLHGNWNPPAVMLPMIKTGAIATIVLALSIVAIVILLMSGHRGAKAPR
jgi:membrane protease YdiL (CAAX protease family)